MPYSSNGVYTLPPSYLAALGQTIAPAQHNPPFEDIQAALSQVVVRDGRAPLTGALNFNGFKATGLAPATNPADAARFDQIPVASSIVPAGVIWPFAGTTAPTGFLFCYGQTVSRTTYADLFTAIGTAWGAGDGSTTFNLPDLRGRVIAGKDDMGGSAANRLTSPVNGTSLGASGGAQSHVLTLAQTPAHNHGGITGSEGGHSHTTTFSRRTNSNGDLFAGTDPIMGAIGGGGLPEPAAAATSSVAGHTHSITTAGSGEAHPNVQPTIIANYIIRTGL